MTALSTLKLGLCSLTLAVLTPISSAVAVSFYNITDLGTLDSNTTDTRANAINNQGQVVGRETGTSGGEHGFIWQNGTITQLPEFASANPGTTFVDLIPRSINNSGTIAGTVDPTTIGSDIEQGFLWTDNGSGGYNGAYYGDYPNYLEKYFRDINNNNQVAGNYVVSRGANGVSQAYYWENGIVTLLPTLGGNVGTARAINDLTQLVGNIAQSSTERRTTAVLWQKDSNGNFVLNNLGTFGGVQSSAININNAGQVIGQYSPMVTTQTIPFLWQNSIKTDLGSLGGLTGNALSINNLGTIVGVSSTSSNVNHAFVWEDNQIFDLNNLLVNGSGWTLTQATGINDRGQIVGYGAYTDVNGTRTRAFILQPVPESSLVFGLGTLAVLGLAARLKRK